MDGNLSREQYKEFSCYNRIKNGIKYGGLDDLGRATGIEATITKDMLNTGTKANQLIRPKGFGGRLNKHVRGHILAKRF